MLYQTVFLVLSIQATPNSWLEVKPGQCLTVPQLQQLSGVIDTSIYEAESCDANYSTEGFSYQSHSCGIELDAGEWERQLVKHKEAGVFFPYPAPCKISVSYLRADLQVYEDEELMCSHFEPVLKFRQAEEMFTRSYEAGQGTLYLPNPLAITRTWVHDELNLDVCEQSLLSLSYKGWGSFSGEVRELDCYQAKTKLCLSAQLKNSETKDGELCLQVKKIETCKE